MADTDFEAEIACEACGKSFAITCHSLIDVMKDPQAPQKVLDASWFAFVCPYCGEENIVLFPCLYHDGLKKVLIGYADREENGGRRYREMKQMLEGTGKNRSQYDRAVNGWLENSTVRMTDDFSDFQEKVLITYLGLNDRVIEIAKYMTCAALEQAGKIKHADHIHFNMIDGQMKFIIEDGDVTGQADLRQDMYDDIARTVEPGMPRSTEINQAWVNNVLKNSRS